MSIRKTIASIVLALTVLVALGPSTAAAERHRKTYQLQGKVWGIVSFNVQTREIVGISRGRLSHIGKVLLHMRGIAAPPGEPYTGPFTIVARNGDRITGTYELIGGTFNPDFHSANMAMTITGGTGRYAGATGSFPRGLVYLTPFEFPTAGSPFLLETVESAPRGHITY